MIAQAAYVVRSVGAIFGVFFLMGGLHNTLSPIGATESPTSQIIGIALGGFAFIGLITRPASVNRTFALYWLALIPVGLAAASLLWAVEPELAFRKVGGLALTTIFGIWLAERFTPQAVFRIIAFAALGLCLMSWYQVFAQPRLGIHQAWDESAFEHAGAWRGTFSHKNDFGRAIALAATIFTIAALSYRRYRFFFMLALVQAAVLIFRSSSSQSILLLVVPSAAAIIIAKTLDMRIQARTAVLVTLLPMAGALYLVLDILIAAVLGALGRDASLTGRTDIWAAVFEAAQDRLILGAGFGSGWNAIADRLVALSDVTVGHAHNGYLDLLVDLGLVGVATMIGFAVILGRESFTKLRSTHRDAIGLLGIGYVAFYLLGNVAGSFMLQQNSIYWMIPVAVYCLVERGKYPHLAPGPLPPHTASHRSMPISA